MKNIHSRTKIINILLVLVTLFSCKIITIQPYQCISKDIKNICAKYVHLTTMTKEIIYKNLQYNNKYNNSNANIDTHLPFLLQGTNHAPKTLDISQITIHINLD